MNKKADFLTPKALGLILGIICVLIILGAAYKIYNRALVNQETENARHTLDVIFGKIENLENGQSNNFTIQGFKNAENWYLAGWAKNAPADTKPDKCFITSCLCVCKTTTGATKDDCQNSGICETRKIENLLIAEKTITADIQVISPVEGTVDVSAYAIKTSPKIPLAAKLLQIEISKEKNSVQITHYTDDYFQNKQFLPKRYTGGGGAEW